MKRLLMPLAALVLLSGLPSFAAAADKHLVYMQGCCVKGVKGQVAKDYETIAQSLRNAGFNLFFELRTAEQTDGDANVQAYAAKVAEHVQCLIGKGVAAEDITVSGYSLGAMTTLVTAGLTANPKVNYVLLAGCPTNPNVPISIDYTKVNGRVLAIVESADDKFGSCAGRLPNTAEFKEITLNSGEGHKLFRLTDESSMNLWKAPLVQWTRGQH